MGVILHFAVWSMPKAGTHPYTIDSIFLLHSMCSIKKCAWICCGLIYVHLFYVCLILGYVLCWCWPKHKSLCCRQNRDDLDFRSQRQHKSHYTIKELNFVAFYWHQFVWVTHQRGFGFWVIWVSESVTQQQLVGGSRNESIVMGNQWICVEFHTFVSLTAPLPCGRPQGSVLSPLVFTSYLFALGFVSRKRSIAFPFYADDCQIYLPLQQNNAHSVQLLINCFNDIKVWLSQKS